MIVLDLFFFTNVTGTVPSRPVLYATIINDFSNINYSVKSLEEMFSNNSFCAVFKREVWNRYR